MNEGVLAVKMGESRQSNLQPLCVQKQRVHATSLRRNEFSSSRRRAPAYRQAGLREINEFEIKNSRRTQRKDVFTSMHLIVPGTSQNILQHEFHPLMHDSPVPKQA